MKLFLIAAAYLTVYLVGADKEYAADDDKGYVQTNRGSYSKDQGTAEGYRGIIAEKRNYDDEKSYYDIPGGRFQLGTDRRTEFAYSLKQPVTPESFEIIRRKFYLIPVPNNLLSHELN